MRELVERLNIQHLDPFAAKFVFDVVTGLLGFRDCTTDAGLIPRPRGERKGTESFAIKGPLNERRVLALTLAPIVLVWIRGHSCGAP